MALARLVSGPRAARDPGHLSMIFSNSIAPHHVVCECRVQLHGHGQIGERPQRQHCDLPRPPRALLHQKLRRRQRGRHPLRDDTNSSTKSKYTAVTSNCGRQRGCHPPGHGEHQRHTLGTAAQGRHTQTCPEGRSDVWRLTRHIVAIESSLRLNVPYACPPLCTSCSEQLTVGVMAVGRLPKPSAPCTKSATRVFASPCSVVRAPCATGTCARP